MDDETIHALVPAVLEQSRSRETPFVSQAIDRLKETTDIAEDEILYMIAFCLADELERMNESASTFDTDRYRTLLELLPNMPEKQG